MASFPAAKSARSKRLNNIAINQIIRRYADGDRVHYLEVGDQFLEPDGSISEEIMPDLLHLSGEGYGDGQTRSSQSYKNWVCKNVLVGYGRGAKIVA